MSDKRLEHLQIWLRQTLHTIFTIEPASNDASFRRYFRVQYADKTVIAMDAPPEYEDSRPFIDIAQRITQVGVQAPIIYQHNLEQGFLLLSDLGNKNYLSNLNDNSVDQLYADAFTALLTMHKIDGDKLPHYGADLLQQEMDLFDHWFIQQYLQQTLSHKQQQILQTAQAILIENALQQPQVFVHRDYHSRNLMLTDSNNPGVIDFQDAVIGPVTYDLVSLLRDCYISWPDKKIQQWLKQFYQQANIQADLAQFIRWFDLMGLQRHIKVLGIFARLHYRDNKPGYLKDLPLTYHYIKKIADKYTELTDFTILLDELKIDSTLQKLHQ